MTIEPAPKPEPQKNLVLAADDNEQNLQLVEEYLWQWGYDVVVARDGREALNLFPQHAPDLVLLDVMMPNMDGYEACARIKSMPQGRRVPIVMLTALTGAEEKIRALEFGADDFLTKPINREELRARIRSLIRIHNLRKELDSSENIIVTLTSALENKDPRSGGHVQRVASYAAQICDRLGMSADDRETIIKGSLLHDLGKIGVPEEILRESAVLDEAQRKILDEHTRMGESILRPLRTFQQFLPIVRSHHERWDGKGYPDELSGDDIPIEARIVAVANRFDDIRQLETASQEEALARLADETADGAFDPSVMQALASALREETPPPHRKSVSIRRRQPRPRILAVDDSETNRELLATTLSDVGFDVALASDGREALATLESKEIDLAILDLMMPVQDGEDVLRRIRSHPRFEFLPVVVLTAQNSDQVRREMILAGADDFLHYPLNRLELITRIRSLLRIRSYHADLEESQNIIFALALALEAKDSYTKGHSQRVGDLGRAFALHLGLDAARADVIRSAGLLHDIGKIAVSESLLNKKGALTREEFMRVIDHPVIGEEICRPLISLSETLAMIRHHHERYDGRGYPDGLAGEAIPFDVRLISIVDAYDALTSHRAYRPSPLEHEAALETLRREADAGKWDPELVTSFCGMLGSKGPDWDRIIQPIPTLNLDA